MDIDYETDYRQKRYVRRDEQLKIRKGEQWWSERSTGEGPEENPTYGSEMGEQA